MTEHGLTLNSGVNFDPTLLVKTWDDEDVKKRSHALVAEFLPSIYNVQDRASWLLKAVSFIDLTTLAGDDTEKRVNDLCAKALFPVSQEILKKLGVESQSPTCGAVCVYPARIQNAVKALKRGKSSLPVASVAAGFPAGQTFLSVKLLEVKEAIAAGATEIDIVISRDLALAENWEALYQEIKQLRSAVGPNAHMKTILAVGELSSFSMVYKASMVAMMAGSDFIKTSTGKESVNATIPVGYVMSMAIKDYFAKTGKKVGLKPAGGLKSTADAMEWIAMVKALLGDEWLDPSLFRIGASSLLGDVEKELFKQAFGKYP